MERLIKILQEVKPGVDFTTSKAIVDEGLLVSMDIVRLINKLSDEFDIELEVTDLVPENFNSLEAMMAMIKRLEDE